MVARRHGYSVKVTWTGNRGVGTRAYTDYARDHEIAAPGKPIIPGSSDPAFRGDNARWNPEELLLAALSACHKLWYLHLCAAAGICVTAYEDQAEAIMEEDALGSGRFIDAVLRPRVVIGSGDAQRAAALHHEAHACCFIANSVNFPVRCEPSVERA